MEISSRIMSLMTEIRTQGEKIQKLIENNKALKISESEHARKFEELTKENNENKAKVFSLDKELRSAYDLIHRLQDKGEELMQARKKTLLDYILDLFKK